MLKFENWLKDRDRRGGPRSRGHWYPYDQEIPNWDKARENYRAYGKTFLRSHHEPDFWRQFPRG